MLSVHTGGRSWKGVGGAITCMVGLEKSLLQPSGREEVKNAEVPNGDPSSVARARPLTCISLHPFP